MKVVHAGVPIFAAGHLKALHGSAGLQRTKQEVVKVVHVGVSTIANRLRELAGTETGLLTCAQLRVSTIQLLSHEKHLLLIGAPYYLTHYLLAQLTQLHHATPGTLCCAVFKI